MIQESLNKLNLELSYFVLNLAIHEDKETKNTITLIKVDGKKEKLLPFRHFLPILSTVNWNEELPNNINLPSSLSQIPCASTITTREQAESILMKVISQINSILSIHWNYLTDLQLKNLQCISELELDVNPVYGKLGDLGNKVSINNMILRIARPLQQSIGI